MPVFLTAVRFDRRRRYITAFIAGGAAAVILLPLTILLTETYLLVDETVFLFSLMSAVFYKYASTEQGQKARHQTAAAGKRYWLILSYRANVPGSACAQHLDDRLPCLERAGITPILLTGPVGDPYEKYCHVRTFSIAPSGIRFELRHYLRKRFRKRWQFKLVETVLLLPLLPFYLLEKIVINLESEWSWFFLASIHGAILQWRFKPEVMYSTGGSASAHVAALFISRIFSPIWLAETQDPLVHDHEWQRSRMVFKLYKWLERQISLHCDWFIFLTRQALHNAQQRVAAPFSGTVIYPGAPAGLFSSAAVRPDKTCRFAHFGSLAGSRNLVMLFQAIHLLLQEKPKYRDRIQIDLYGSVDGESEKMMKQLHLTSLVTHHGLVNRREAVAAMQQAGCLLLIQNTSYFSTETIPSKVYEYLLSRRPVLALLYQNQELAVMLNREHHFLAAADDADEIKTGIETILELFARSSFSLPAVKAEYTVERAVNQLVSLARGQYPDEPDGIRGARETAHNKPASGNDRTQ